MMKKILLTGSLTTALLLAACSGETEETNTEADNTSEEMEQLQAENEELKTQVEELEGRLAEQDEEQTESDNQENDTEEVEASSASEAVDAGSRTEPLALGEKGTMSILTYTDDEDMEEINGVAEITVDNVVRGEEAVSILTGEYSEPEEAPEGMEWIVFDTTISLTELSDENEEITFSDDFTAYTSDGSEIERVFTTFDEEFGIQGLYSGGTATGKTALLAPAGEPFLIKYDDYLRAEAYYQVD